MGGARHQHYLAKALPAAAVILLLAVSASRAYARPSRALLQTSTEDNSTETVGNATVAAKYAPVIEGISHFLEVTRFSPNASARPNFWAPRVIRLAWHTSGTYDPNAGVGGSNGATMRFPPESTDPENNGLNVTRDQLEQFKQEFPWITYADLWTLAGCVAVKNMGGPRIMWRPGRTDAVNNSTAPPNGNLPVAEHGADHIRDVFGRMNFTDREAVALIGAHSVGGCHQELSGYQGQWSLTPQVFDNAFFKNMLNVTWTIKTTHFGEPWTGKRQFTSDVLAVQNGVRIRLMMLPTDLALRDDDEFLQWVELYAQNQTLWFEDFAAAFRKVLEQGVDFGDEDEAFLV